MKRDFSYGKRAVNSSRLTLHTQVSVLAGVLLIVVISIGAGYSIRSHYGNQIENLKEVMRALSESVANVATRAIAADDFSRLEDAILGGLDFREIESIELVRLDGQVLGRGFKANDGTPLLTYDLNNLEVPEEVKTIGSQAAFIFQEGSVILWHPVDKYEFVGWIKAKASLKLLNDHYADYLRDYLGLLLASAMLMVGLLTLVLRGPLLSLRSATQFAKSLLLNKGSELKIQGSSREVDELILALNEASQELKFQEESLAIKTKELEFSLRQVQKFNEILEENVRNRTKDLQEANRNLSGALKAKGEFLANMSHEIRTPLNAILGITSVLADMSLSDELKGYLKIQDTAGRNLSSFFLSGSLTQ